MQVTYNITLPDGTTVTMTAAEVMQFHDDLTKFINANYEALNE